MTSFLNFVLNVPLWAWIIVAIIIIAIIINIVESIITRNHINAVYRAVNPLDSHLRDYNCNQRDILLRIERRCDKIDQRTQAHFAKKPKPKTASVKNSVEAKKVLDNYKTRRLKYDHSSDKKQQKTYRRIEYDK
jgi:hypothetical protein